MKLYNFLVSDDDDPGKNAINVTRFTVEGDTVVVKTDIEGSELKRWMDDREMVGILDERFVEVHYSHPSMAGFGWLQFKEHSREDAVSGASCRTEV